MKIALMSEGTYPHQFGGVSVWCDQLVRGMPEHQFHITALVATGNEPTRWELPDNVASVVSVPLWGSRVPAGRKPDRAARQRFSELLSEFLDLLMSTKPSRLGFGGVIAEMFEYAQRYSLPASFTSEESVALMSAKWQEYGATDAPESARPTLHDALMAMQLMEHSLRGLSHPPEDADVVHAVTNGLGALPGLAVKWRYGRPLIVTEHGIYLREQFLHARRSPYRWPVRQLYMSFLRRITALGYQYADVITPGNVYNRRWEEHLGASRANIRTVYNGVDPANFPEAEGEPAAPTISWVGRIDPIKDIETLLRAFALVHEEIPEARLRVFGSPPGGREAYLERCKNLGRELAGDAVTFEGRVEIIRDAYEAGHVVALTSLSEGFPYSIIEAMTTGRPCVSTDVGGVREAIGDTGVVVPPRSPRAFADACLTLLRDDTLRRRLGAAARARALEYFTVDKAINTFDEMYSLLGSGRPLMMPSSEPVEGVA